ncbi:DUF975 family protein [Paenibacillus doosanensis]|uniref:DUF975 family protein n=1 Tax=Paenibacillus doosanensis TaxID=1229154 RepID=UPI00217FD74E|nr:DUF975 family protein [Paenibacillus doosanensis]MCS7464574.1 DUF975 family protein [Paenibacillus doosanensis]
MLTNSELRRVARESLQGNWAGAIGATIIVSVILTIAAMIPGINWLLSLIIAGPFLLGLFLYFIRLVRGEEPKVENVFHGFRQFLNSFVLYLLISIFVTLWMLLLIVPGVIAALRYSQAYFIMNDNPDISGLDAIRQSKLMMDGHKMRLFMLCLSFLGWFVLGFILFGIGLIWVIPYFYAALAAFHQDLKHRTETYQANFDSLPM